MTIVVKAKEHKGQIAKGQAKYLTLNLDIEIIVFTYNVYKAILKLLIKNDII